jgi:integrase
MFNVNQIKKLETGRILGFSNGFYAKCNKDNTISLILKKRLTGKRDSDKPKTLVITKVYKEDNNLTKLVMEANQKALDWITLMQQGIHPLQHQIETKKETTRKTITLLQALEKFEQNVKANDSNSERTLSDRRNIFKNVCPELMDREIIKIDDDTILDKYYYFTSAQNKKRRTVEIWLQYMSAIFNFLIGLKIVTDNPVSRLRKAKIIVFQQFKDKDNFLLPSETKTLIRHINSFKSFNQKTDFYLLQSINLIYLLLLTGLRASETKSILWENVHLEGTELNPEPYIVLNKQDRKQGEPFAIAITPEIKKIIDFQLLLIGQGNVVNLADVFKPKPKKPKYLFVSKNDMRVYHPSKEQQKKKRQAEKKGRKFKPLTLNSRPCSRIRNGFALLRERMGEIKNGQFSPNTLRHTFTTFGNLLGYSDAELDSITGHINQTSKTATQVYVARVVKDNRQAFINIQEAMLGNDVEDRHFKRREDNFEKQLNKANKEELLNYYHQGLLTKEEEDKYKIYKLLKQEYKEQFGYGSADGVPFNTDVPE